MQLGSSDVHSIRREPSLGYLEVSTLSVRDVARMTSMLSWWYQKGVISSVAL